MANISSHWTSLPTAGSVKAGPIWNLKSIAAMSWNSSKMIISDRSTKRCTVSNASSELTYTWVLTDTRQPRWSSASMDGRTTTSCTGWFLLEIWLISFQLAIWTLMKAWRRMNLRHWWMKSCQCLQTEQMWYRQIRYSSKFQNLIM